MPGPRWFIISFCLSAASLVLRGQQQPAAGRPPNWPCTGARAVDPSYVAVTEGTGGHLYLFAPGEVTQSGALMAWNFQHQETVFRAMGEMASAAHELSFPVDSMVESLVIAVSLQCKEAVAIVDPAGVESGGSGGERLDFRAGSALRIVHPTPGLWKVRLAGRGLYFVTAEAKSALTLDSARFVEAGGRPGHEGLFPVKQPPALGSKALLQLELSKAVGKVRVKLVDSQARTLAELAAQPLDGTTGGSFLTAFILNAPSFRIAVEGVDERDWPFLRMDPPLTVATAPPPR